MSNQLFTYDENGNKVWFTVTDTEHTAQVNTDHGQNLQNQVQQMKDQKNQENNQKQISIFNKFFGRE